MELVNQIVNLLVVSAIGFTVFKTYLTANKVWSRKHEKVVAESISVTAQIIGLLTALPFIIKYVLIDKDYMSLTNMSIKLGLTIFFLMISIGVWVRVGRKESLWTKTKRALKLEKEEGLDLINAVLKPAGANIILDILKKLALVDKELDDREKLFIQEFADNWHINISFEDELAQATKMPATQLHIDLRKKVTDYLNISPDKKQASQLLDLLNSLATADENVSGEETFILNEIKGMIKTYINDGEAGDSYVVMLVPQRAEKIAAVRALLPDVEPKREWGGDVYYAGIFHSRPYALMIAQKYQALDLFATVKKLNQTESTVG